VTAPQPPAGAAPADDADDADVADDDAADADAADAAGHADPAAGDAARCPRCLLRKVWCLCAELPTVITRTRIDIVRHYREVTRSSNSGRLAQLALPSCRILDHGAPGAPPVIVDPRGACLLFPGGELLTADNAPERLIILDATWSQARRMRRKVRGLEAIRTVSIPPVSTDAPRMRASPGEGKVSTLEAIAHALGVIEGAAVREPLLALFQLAVARSRATGRTSPALGAAGG
jgi:DTW domain-containing protein YfiP